MPFFIHYFNSLSCELDNFTFKVLHSVKSYDGIHNILTVSCEKSKTVSFASSIMKIIIVSSILCQTRFPVKLNLLHYFWISIKYLLFTYIYCYHLIIVFEINIVAQSSLWSVAIFLIVSYVLTLFLTNWSKKIFHQS